MKNAITWRILDSKLGRMIGGTTDKGVCLLEFVERKSLNTILTKLEKKHRLPLLYDLEGDSQDNLLTVHHADFRRFSIHGSHMTIQCGLLEIGVEGAYLRPLLRYCKLH